ncbi:MAG: MBL fold metallo-hydrolase [Pontibacterium sp.]
MKIRFLITVLLSFISSSLFAQPVLETIKVSDRVYALVGPLEQRSERNLGNNATFGFVITDKGIVLIDSGGTQKGAQAIEQVIAQVSKLPVVMVINTGGQDHRWFGNQYFIRKGARVLTSEQTRQDQKSRGQAQQERMGGWVKSAWMGTEPVPAPESVDSGTEISVGGVTLSLIPAGPAHTGGETLVWIPQENVLFSGDVVYVERMLGVGAQSQHKPWIEAVERIVALKPAVIIPGHGHPTDLKTVKRDTLDYLLFLRKAVGQLLEEGGEMQEVSNIDQSRFSYLKVYDQIHVRNAQRVFEEMEWE